MLLLSHAERPAGPIRAIQDAALGHRAGYRVRCALDINVKNEASRVRHEAVVPSDEENNGKWIEVPEVPL